MSHLLILPVLLPLITAAVLMGGHRLPIDLRRVISLSSAASWLLLSVVLVMMAGEGVHIYQLGGWAPPFGIVLVLDRFSALMLALTAVLAMSCLVFASRGSDQVAEHFHALFQFQLAGLAVTFLTGDLFNLFVGFELLLIASYALLVHGGGGARSGAGMHYVALNLVGSAIFLVAIAVIYGLTGTLNMADLSRVIAVAPAENHALLHAAGLILLVVFGLKAALLPLLFWLPRAYVAANAPVAALFAIMTKVGVYAILRVHGLLFGEAAGPLAGIAWPWLFAMALATIVFALVGLLAANSLRMVAAYLVILSSGTLLAAAAGRTPELLGALLYYLPGSVLGVGALFLLAELVAERRGRSGDRFDALPEGNGGIVLGTIFLLLAVGLIGLPPLSGFLGKLLMLQASLGSAWPPGMIAAFWCALLFGGLIAVIALSRAGSRLFWESGGGGGRVPVTDRVALGAVLSLLLVIVGLSIAAGPVSDYTLATAEQMLGAEAYRQAVLDTALRAGEGL